jgi:hypothetical protein
MPGRRRPLQAPRGDRARRSPPPAIRSGPATRSESDAAQHEPSYSGRAGHRHKTAATLGGLCEGGPLMSLDGTLGALHVVKQD